MKWAEEVWFMGNTRNQMSFFDFAMAFALRKPIKIECIISKTFNDIIKQYGDELIRNDQLIKRDPPDLNQNAQEEFLI